MDAGFESIRITEALQHVLGALFKSLAAFDKLVDRLEPRGPLGEHFVRFDGGRACRVEIAAGVLIGTLGGLERFLKLGELGTGGFHLFRDAGAFGAEFLQLEIQALLFVRKLAGTLASAL